jgi:hypothetical protein
MSFKDTFIEHEVPPEVQDWIKGEIEAQEKRYVKIDKAMKDMAPRREQWYQEFFDRITTLGYNMDGDDKMLIDPKDLPVKPEGCEDRVVWKHGTDSDPSKSHID